MGCPVACAYRWPGSSVSTWGNHRKCSSRRYVGHAMDRCLGDDVCLPPWILVAIHEMARTPQPVESCPDTDGLYLVLEGHVVAIYSEACLSAASHWSRVFTLSDGGPLGQLQPDQVTAHAHFPPASNAPLSTITKDSLEYLGLLLMRRRMFVCSCMCVATRSTTSRSVSVWKARPTPWTSSRHCPTVRPNSQRSTPYIIALHASADSSRCHADILSRILMSIPK